VGVLEYREEEAIFKIGDKSSYELATMLRIGDGRG